MLSALQTALASDNAITAFVNNAGIASASKLLESDPDYLDQIVQINVTALTRLAIAAASSFAKRASGLIINIGSVVALAPELLNGVYSGSKAFVQNFSTALKNELAEERCDGAGSASWRNRDPLAGEVRRKCSH